MKFPNNLLFFALAACIGLVITSCKEDVTVSLTTYSVYNVTNTSASVNGIVSIVGDDIKESGFLFSAIPTLILKYTNCSRHESTGSLTDVRATFDGLSADSSYRYSLYVKTDDSIYYGSTYSFYPGSVVIPTEFINGGTYQMGGTAEQDTFAKDNEFPVHTVTVGSFLMGTTEVTNAQFLKFLISRKIGSGEIGSSASGIARTFIKYDNLLGLKFNTTSAAWVIKQGFEDHPVVNVTWFGVNEFCRWAGGRLPTEAEWEWAARGGNEGNQFLFSGSNLTNLSDFAWYNANVKDFRDGSKDTQPVGTKGKNGQNLFDMSGNVWEWVADWYNLYLPLDQINPKGMSDADAAESGLKDKVCRGGGWADIDVDGLRVSKRGHIKPDSMTGSCGFRFAKDL